ncbi:MAG: CPBP family intramembrane metalloprotease [Spirochaetales bacterium]|nr:CPBP family intramembrane metalloprotease [Spirochaetales bacterium]
MVIIPTALVIFFYPKWELLKASWPLMAAALWIFTGHILSGFSYWLTSLSLKKGFSLFRNSFLAYRKFRSIVGLQSALLVSLAEEMVFRYFLLTWLVPFLNSSLLATLGVSLLFTLFHFHHGFSLKSLFRYADFFILSIILCLLTLATISIYPAIFIHATRNYLLKVMFVRKDVYQNMVKGETAKKQVEQ